jgi:phage/plasmid primase-like uncharacterized protein
MTTATQLDAFRQVLEMAGLHPPAVIPPGEMIRFPGVGKSNGNTSGWAKLFADGQAGAYGDWASDLSGIWHAERSTRMTTKERDAHKGRIAELQRIRQEEERKAHEAAAQRAQTMWDGTAPALEDHPFLQKKGIHPHGLRVDADNRLLVPVMIGGILSSLQFINANGGKEFLSGGKVKGGSYTIGEMRDAAIIGVGEGFSTCASVNEATGYPTVCAFSANKLTLVAQQLRHRFPTATILICGDNDLHDDGTPNVGLDAATAAAEAIGGVLVMPDLDGRKCDWNDVQTQCGLDAVKKAIEAVLTREQEPETMTTTTAMMTTPTADTREADRPGNSFLAYRPGGLPETNFNPISAPDLLAEVFEPTDWILEDYLPAGSLALIAGKPKEGKTTLVYEFAVKVAQGGVFLGRTTRKGGVLILAVEEHRRDVKLRLQNLGAEGLDDLYLHIGALSPTPTFFAHLSTFIHDHDIRLVIIDTLAAFWSVDNENDASEMTKAVKPLLRLARESEACILLIHHARKSEGSHGDEIRGSGALFGLVDIAIVMKRHSVETQRLLQAQSRYPETPSELVLELREHGYVALGDPAAVGKADKLRRLRAVLTDDPQETESLAKKAGLSRRDATRLLDLLVKDEETIREGKGKRNDPHRFRRIVSGNPPISRDASKQETLDSFLAPLGASVPPARNETRNDEVIDEA